MRIALVGNPNVGKTSIFNYITGSKFKVGNFPGVTVEKKESFMLIENQQHSLVDLPGIYSLVARSPDEKIARECIISKDPEYAIDMIINVVDANNLNRNLYLTTFLLELEKPMLIVLTMTDMLKINGKEISAERLSENLNIPVIIMDPRLQMGKQELIKAIQEIEISQSPFIPKIFPPIIYTTTEKLRDKITESSLSKKYYPQFCYSKLLEGDFWVESLFKNDSQILKMRDQAKEALQQHFVNDLSLVLAQFRYHYIDRLLEGVNIRFKDKVSLTQKLDSVLLNRIWGFPSFLLILWFCFKIFIGIGTALQDFFDITFGALFVDYIGNFFIGHPFLKLIFADGIGSGLQAMTTFIPVVFMVFVCMNLLEDSGYMARVTVLVDRFMRLLGLPGKSLAPLIMGFGCNVTSIMGSRILETPEERKIMIAMSPFISCSARLPLYVVISMALFPESKGTVIFSLYFIGLLSGIFVAFLVHSFLYQERIYSYLLLELPEYNRPKLKIIMATSWRNLKNLLKRGFLLIIYFTAVFQVLNQMTLSHPSEGFFVKDNDTSLMQQIAKAMTYPLHPMGIREENWPAAVGLINGLLAKEAVVGSLVVSYATVQSNEAQKQTIQKISQKEALFGLWSKFKEALLTIPHNLFGHFNEKGSFESGLLTSIGFYIPFYDFFKNSYEKDDRVTQSTSIIPMIRRQFEDPSILDPAKRKLDAKFAAYAFLIFSLLYTGCVAVMATLKKELGLKWMMGIIIYQLIFSYGVAVVFYQSMKFFFI